MTCGKGYKLLIGKSSEKYFVGYDLGNRYCQISVCPWGGRNPETLPSVAGSENYNIPTVLLKRKGANQWLFGREACSRAAESEGIRVDNLLELAKAGEKVLIDGSEFDPVALLTLFIKRSFSLLAGPGSGDKIGALMFTCSDLGQAEVEVLRRVIPGLGLKTREIYFQRYEDSIYYYNLYQEAQTWNHQVLVCDYREDTLRIYCMERNKRTTPTVVFIGEQAYPFQNLREIPEEEYLREPIFGKMDQEFLEILEELCSGQLISSVYLLGEGFGDEWLKESLRFLCRNRRVFQGNNLFSKGACYGVIERESASDAGKSHVFLGNEKLKSNIGMKVLRRGEDSYFALLDAGVNWYEVHREVDFFLEEGTEFHVIVTPLTGKDVQSVIIRLEGLPERPPGTTRLHLQVDMTEENRVRLQIEDRGFGELFPASDMSWTEILEV